MALNIKIIKRGTVGEVRLIGKMDSISAAEAEKALLSVADRFDHIVLDLAELQYITSAGLRVLKSLYKNVRIPWWLIIIGAFLAVFKLDE